MLPIEQIPPQFREKLQFQFKRWLDRTDQAQQQLLESYLADHAQHAQQLAKVWLCSEYILNVALDQPAEFLQWLQQSYFEQSLSQPEMAELLCQRLHSCELDDKQYDRQLRKFRRDMMMRIVWRDFCRLASFEETSRDMSHLAEVVVQSALSYHHSQLQLRFGVPLGKVSGLPQPMVVLGMGKLGGFELNVSSDVDLIFAYPESGETEGGNRSISNQEYFIKLSQKLIASIDTTTVDGFVFRVDMRLRPYGESGAMVLNFDAMEEYYQTQGREWERYAMIKARVISADAMSGGVDAGQQLMALLQPFTYRRYLDYSAIESMRSMKALINREVQRKGMGSDVKLGAGGIREVEFVVQVFQMIRGGRDTRLQERSVLTLLPLLASEGFLSVEEADHLAAAYIFLRNAEHGIQGFQDKQSQSLPADDEGQSRLAWLLEFDSWGDFEVTLNLHRQRVHRAFTAVISEPNESDAADQVATSYTELWPSVQARVTEIDVEGLQQLLAEKDFLEPKETAVAIVQLLGSRALIVMQSIGRDRLDQLMPLLLEKIAERRSSAETLSRIIVLIEAVARCSAYFTLLIENPGALEQLVTLCGSSQWIADQLTRYPALLDELLDVRTLYSPPNRDALRDELRQEMMRISWEDMETQMETLRYFRNAHGLRVAASEVAGILPLMKVSDYLTWIAEVVLEHVVSLCWQQMIARHGRPQLDDQEQEAEFIVVGYGKLGGYELGHSSDLDLVFLYDAKSNGYSDGERSIDHQTYFSRLGQKIIHVLNANTPSGQLYEVDMRLRPSGNSGLLVSSRAAFIKYQQEEAWTWEHQALIRARVIVGNGRLRDAFEMTRSDILCTSRDLQVLRNDVFTMRQKMRNHLGSKAAAEDEVPSFHLKQDAGGIVDIEFIVQYLALAYACKFPSLVEYTDNIRILEAVEGLGLLSSESVQCLRDAYIFYRSIGHKLSLQGSSNSVDVAEIGDYRDRVLAIWASVFEG